MRSKRIIVVGSSNTDMVIKTAKHPRPGETVLGGEFYMLQGGKGANQAVAVARLGGDSTFICKVGNDSFGQASLSSYLADGVDTTCSFITDEAPSGIALITVDKEGENSIVVASGANALLSPEDIVKVQSVFANADIVLMQMEIPMETILCVAKIAVQHGVKVILNPAPAAILPDALYAMLYLITPNRTEAELLTGIEINDMESAKIAADKLAAKGVEKVIITLGSHGAIIKENDSYHHVPAQKVDVVDTTAAGDTFNGALCVALAEGAASLADAVAFASRAAAITVTRMGAQVSIPTRIEVDNI